MFEMNVTSSSLDLTNLANFTTDLVRFDLDTSELEIKMNVSKMKVISNSDISDHRPGGRGSLPGWDGA